MKNKFNAGDLVATFWHNLWLMSEPTHQSKIIEKLSTKDVLLVTSSKRLWIKVLTPRGKQGWIELGRVGNVESDVLS